MDIDLICVVSSVIVCVIIASFMFGLEAGKQSKKMSILEFIYEMKQLKIEQKEKDDRAIIEYLKKNNKE